MQTRVGDRSLFLFVRRRSSYIFLILYGDTFPDSDSVSTSLPFIKLWVSPSIVVRIGLTWYLLQQLSLPL
jgi:hypothetical protein